MMEIRFGKIFHYTGPKNKILKEMNALPDFIPAFISKPVKRGAPYEGIALTGKDADIFWKKEYNIEVPPELKKVSSDEEDEPNWDKHEPFMEAITKALFDIDDDVSVITDKLFNAINDNKSVLGNKLNGIYDDKSVLRNKLFNYYKNAQAAGGLDAEGKPIVEKPL